MGEWGNCDDAARAIGGLHRGLKNSVATPSPRVARHRNCARGYRLPKGSSSTITCPSTPHRERGRGSLIDFVAVPESKKAPPMARASFDVVRRGRVGHNVKAGNARGAR